MLPDSDFEVRIAKSGFRAVFALRDFMPGEIIFKWDTTNTFTDEKYAELSGEQKAYARRFEGIWTYMTEPVCYVRHVSNANALSRRGTVIAIKEIHLGEEITINYETELA